MNLINTASIRSCNPAGRASFRHITRHSVVILLVCLATCKFRSQVLASDVTDSSHDNVGLGYLTAPSLSPGHILRPSSLFVLPENGPQGTPRIDFDAHWANIWDYEPDAYMIDGEWIRSNIRLSYALKDSFSVGIAVPIIGRTGGFADPLIERFHKTFHMDDAERDEFPQNRSLISVNEKDGDHTIIEGDSWGIGDISAFAVSRIAEGGSILPALTVQGQISAPTGDKDELRGLGAPSFALSAVASKRLGGSPFILFGGAGFQYCSADEIGGIELRHDEWAGLGGFEYQFTHDWSLVAQYLVSTPVARDYFAFSDPTHEISAGCKLRIMRDIVLEFAIVENILIYNNSEDIGVHFSLGKNL